MARSGGASGSIAATVCAAAIVLAPLFVHADPRRLTGVEIEALLNDAAVTSADGWTQRFDRDGGTAYSDRSSPTSYGRWAVRGDDFCSYWGRLPPASDSRGWVCYSVFGDPAAGTVVWVSPDGVRYEARIDRP